MSDDVLRLVGVCDELLGRIAALLGEVAPEALARPAPGGGTGAGAHVRHCLEFFDCFLAGLAGGRVDYDARLRDPRLETDPGVALDCIVAQRLALRALGAAAADAPLRVRADELDAGPDEGFLPSCITRELRALASHTVHHLAFVALLLRVQGVAVDPRLGVAPSTLAHARRCR